MTEVHLPNLISDIFGGSRSEARRIIAQGGVKLRGSQLSNFDMDTEDLNGELQVGHRRWVFLVNGEVVAGA